MEPEYLKVPIAIDENGAELRPEDAVKGSQYYCPDCQNALILRKGLLVRTHFAHKEQPTRCDFINETEQHFRAKLAIVAAVKEKKPVYFVRHCKVCSKAVYQDLPDKVTDVKLEYTLSSNHRADVALFDKDDELLAIIEVFVTHAVEDEKLSALAEIPWAEFSAETILTSPNWSPIKDNFKPCTCNDCRIILKFGKKTCFMGLNKAQVQCPLQSIGIADTVENCDRCEHFVDVSREGILCVGSRVSYETD